MSTQIHRDFTIQGFDDVVGTVRSFMTRTVNEGRPLDGSDPHGGQHGFIEPYQRCWLCGPPYSGKARALRLLAEELGSDVSLFVDATALSHGSPASDEVASYLDSARGSTEPRVLLVANGHRAPEPHRESTPPEMEVADAPGQEYAARSPEATEKSRLAEPGAEDGCQPSVRRIRVTQRQWGASRHEHQRGYGPVMQLAERIARESLPVLIVVSSDDEPPQQESGARAPFETILRSHLPRKGALKEIWTQVLIGVATDESVDVRALVDLSVGYTANDVAMTVAVAIQKARIHQGRPVDEVRLGQIDLLGAMEVSSATIAEWEHDRTEENSTRNSLSAALAGRRPGATMKPKAHPRDIRYVRRGIRERRENLAHAMHEEMNRIRAKWNDVQLDDLHIDQ